MMATTRLSGRLLTRLHDSIGSGSEGEHSTFYTSPTTSTRANAVESGHRRVASSSSHTHHNMEISPPSTSSADGEHESGGGKLAHLKERLARVTLEHEADVEEYLRMTNASPGDNPQMMRVTQRFEKKNKRYAQETESIQRKMEALGSRRPENVLSGLKGMGGALKDTLTDYTGTVLQAPRTMTVQAWGMANKLKNKFGSADNLHSPDSESPLRHTTIARTASTLPQGMGLSSVLPVDVSPLAKREDADEVESRMLEHLRGVESSVERIHTQLQSESTFVHTSLHEERFRAARLEERLNDSIELHQEEVKTLKLEMQRMANRIEYAHMESARELRETMETCANRVALLEQTAVNGREGEMSSWHTLSLHLANVAVELIKLSMYLSAAACDLIKPLVGSRNKAALVLLGSLLLLFIITYLPLPRVLDRSS